MPILEKINKVMQLVHGVEKTGVNKAKGGYKFAGHEAVNAALRGHFAELGIVRAVSMVALDILEAGTVKAHVRVTYTDAHDLTAVHYEMFAIQPSQTSKGSLEAQQVGQCLSYAVKNIEFKLFALTGDSEPDSDTTAAQERDEPEPESPTSTQAKDRAGELLTMFTRAASLAEVDDISAMVKAEWPDLRSVKGFAERVGEIRLAAQKRLGAP